MGRSQLGQGLRQVSRAVMLAPPGITLTLEISLRGMGLRDAAEAARAVVCCFHLAAMQLPPRCVRACARSRAYLCMRLYACLCWCSHECILVHACMSARARAVAH